MHQQSNIALANNNIQTLQANPNSTTSTCTPPMCVPLPTLSLFLKGVHEHIRRHSGLL